MIYKYENKNSQTGYILIDYSIKAIQIGIFQEQIILTSFRTMWILNIVSNYIPFQNKFLVTL